MMCESRLGDIDGHLNDHHSSIMVTLLTFRRRVRVLLDWRLTYTSIPDEFDLS